MYVRLQIQNPAPLLQPNQVLFRDRSRRKTEISGVRGYSCEGVGTVKPVIVRGGVGRGEEREGKEGEERETIERCVGTGTREGEMEWVAEKGRVTLGGGSNVCAFCRKRSPIDQEVLCLMERVKRLSV